MDEIYEIHDISQLGIHEISQLGTPVEIQFDHTRIRDPILVRMATAWSEFPGFTWKEGASLFHSYVRKLIFNNDQSDEEDQISGIPPEALQSFLNHAGGEYGSL